MKPNDLQVNRGRHSGPGGGTRRFRVGIRLPLWSIGYAVPLFEGILKFQRTHGTMELHFDQPSGGDLPPDPVNERWEGDGLLVYRYTQAEAKAWRSRGIAVVNLSTEYPGPRPEFPRVTMDNGLVGRAAAEHLGALGLRDFAYVHESTRRYSAERLEAFREAVAAMGGRYHQIDVPASSFPARNRPRRIEECSLGPLEALPRPCGILTKDDIAATWTLRNLHKMGIDCPEEMPILGIDDDMVYCHMTDPPLSSIPYPARKIGFVAVELLSRMMGGARVAKNHRLLLPPRPVAVRESTRRVVLPDMVVTRALELIRSESMHRLVSVAELTRAVGVSRESLRQRFRAALGHSPKREIERIRCHHVRELLRGSDQTLESIAAECGFSGADEVCRFIKRMTGKTPGTIRREETW